MAEVVVFEIPEIRGCQETVVAVVAATTTMVRIGTGTRVEAGTIEMVGPHAGQGTMKKRTVVVETGMVTEMMIEMIETMETMETMEMGRR